MKYIINKIKTGSLIAVAAMAVLASCNKDMPAIEGPTPISPNPVPSTARALGDTLNTPARANDSLFYKLIVRGGMLATLNNKQATYTMFVPTNAAMRTFLTAASGGAIPAGSPDAVYVGFINTNLPAASAAGIVSYNIIPQKVLAANIPATFPNFQYPTLINPAPQISALLRLTTFPSTRNGAFLNNTPITSTDNLAANGVFHEIANVVTPPSQYLWDRINADAGLTYLKAAILRADSGVAVTSAGSLQGALLNIGANLTVYAPTDAAFRTTLTGAITQALIPQVIAQITPAIIAQLIAGGATPEQAAAQAPAIAAAQAPAIAFTTATSLAATPAVFTNPALYGALTATVVKGIVVYHLLGVRAFNNNLPTTAANFPTLLNGGIPSHPGVSLQASLTGGFVTAATVKGIANGTASNILINPTPAPNGTSDQFYLNGVLQKIDQVLLPQ
jgi:uncharacterized surface protein with fasciclin (FAS1) repeats